MSVITIEHSRLAYLADYVLYGCAVALLAAFLMIEGPVSQRLEITTLTLLGLVAWTAIEYVVHRFVLHGLEPFRSWHLEHHRRPAALIYTPTILSASLIVVLVFLPALLLGNVWLACALTLGLLTGYLGYAITHHAVHHWHIDNAWLKKRKRWHALHHSKQTSCYGVTSSFWDLVFASVPAVRISSSKQNN